MNNKGEKYLSVYWFAILVIVAGGIALIVITFYGKPIDIREIEAGVLINKIVDCISEGNGLKQGITNENFLTECHFIINDEYYLDIDELGIIQGNSNLKDYCNLNQQGVVCVNRNFYVVENGEGKWINLFVALNKEDKNVQ